MHPLLLLLAVLAIPHPATQGAPDARSGFAIVPAPLVLTPGAGSFQLSGDVSISIDGEGLEAVARYLKENLLPDASLQQRGSIRLTTRDADPALGDEGYELIVGPGEVVIRAGKPAGAFYGVQTLRQLLPASVLRVQRGQTLAIPAVHIKDKPRFRVRGFMLDSCRHIQSVEFIKRTIDRVAFHKINTFHWHLSEDQGWRIEIRKYPKLTEVGAWREAPGGQRYGGFYTQEQIRDVVRYAADRFITVVPEIDMPGHTMAALAAYPELACKPGPFKVRTEWGISEDVLCPGKERTFLFMQDVLMEVMELFPSKVIHLGGDECPRVRWTTCPDCQRRIAAEGLADADALQNYFTRRMMRFLAQHGRRLQGWNEIMHGGQLPPEVIVHQWNDPNAGAAAARAGNDVINSMTTHCYFDYDYRRTPLQKVYEFDPMPPGLSPAEAQHILGGQANLWTEWRPTEQSCDEFIWPRMIAMAEALWLPAAGRNYEDFLQRMKDTHYERLAIMGLGAPDVAAEQIKQHLVEPMETDWGKLVLSWTPRDVTEEFASREWDISRFITRPGEYVISFQYDSGAHGLAMRRVTLLLDGREISRDDHQGWAGGISHDNAFKLKVGSTPSNGVYTLRVQLRSDGGTDSFGSIYLKRSG